MTRKQARAYLREMEFNTEKEVVDEFLQAIDRAKRENPGISEEDLLLGMDLDRQSEWCFDPELVELVKAELEEQKREEEEG